MMSSEESDGDDAIAVKPLLWRSDKVVRFFHQLDDKSSEVKTPQAKRQRRRRVISNTPSTRPKPVDPKFPQWVFTDHEE